MIGVGGATSLWASGICMLLELVEGGCLRVKVGAISSS